MWITNPSHSFCRCCSARCAMVQRGASGSKIGLKIRRPSAAPGRSGPGWFIHSDVGVQNGVSWQTYDSSRLYSIHMAAWGNQLVQITCQLRSFSQKASVVAFCSRICRKLPRQTAISAPNPIRTWEGTRRKPGPAGAGDTHLEFARGTSAGPWARASPRFCAILG